MPNTIQHKRSTTASAVPSGASLSAGEIAINTADGRLFIKKSDGTVVAIGRDASELNTGTVAAARLPAATGSTLGAIIVGTGLGVASGTVSVSYGSTSSTACVGNDSRLSDTRTPTDGSVTTAKIADANVTYAKIQNVSATDKLLGRSTAGAGVIEEITCTLFGRSLISSAASTNARTTLGLVIGTDVQAYSATLAAVAGGTYTGATSITTLGTITSGTWTGGTIAVANGGTGATTAANARANLGLSYGSAAGTVCEGSDARLAVAAWVNFDGTANTNLSGTYSQSGTTITVTCTNHGISVGQLVGLNFTSGTAVDNTVTVATVANANTFTVPAGASLTTSGNVTISRSTIRASANISSVADLFAGSYQINFSSAQPSSDYAVIVTANDGAVAPTVAYEDGSAGLRTTWFFAIKVANLSSVLVDRSRISVAVFR